MTSLRPPNAPPYPLRSEFSVSRGRIGTLVPAPLATTAVVPLQFEKPLPSYAQLEQALRDAIIARKLAPGSRLPEERELARQYNVSRGTVRRALSQLEAAGLLVRQQGRGTFVAEPDTLPAVPLAVVLEGKPERAVYGFSGDLFQALLETASRSGAELLLRGSQGQRVAVEPSAYLYLLPRKHSDLRRLAATGVPVIAMDYLVKGPGIDSILFDNVGAGYAATQALIAAGHRRIAYVDPQVDRQGPFTPETNSAARLAGMRKALQEARLPKEQVWRMPLDDRDIRRELPAQLQRHPDVTALFAFDETVATGAWQACQDTGRKVPRDFSIATLRLLDEAPAGGIDWTGWGTSVHGMGRLAVERALWRVQQRAAMETPVGGVEVPAGEVIFVPHRWCPGQTLAAPKSV